MRVDNDGEGGILALMSLLGVKRAKRPLIVAVGLFGAALIYGDGAITPAISVLSALEGLEIAAPSITPYVLPPAVAVLLGAVRHPAAGHGADRPAVRPGDDAVVRRDRAARRSGASCSTRRAGRRSIRAMPSGRWRTAALPGSWCSAACSCA